MGPIIGLNRPQIPINSKDIKGSIGGNKQNYPLYTQSPITNKKIKLQI
jgi:hypothetical protein